MAESMAMVTHRVFQEHFGDRRITGIEIGVLGGSWSNYILTYFPNIEMLHCIDPWKHFDDNFYERAFEQDTHEANYGILLNKLSQWPHRARIYRMGSDEAAKYFAPASVDFCFIDGCHEKPFVERDVANYAKFVKPGGFFGGHDYGQALGVTEVVDQVYPQAKKGDDFVWWSIL